MSYNKGFLSALFTATVFGIILVVSEITGSHSQSESTNDSTRFRRPNIVIIIADDLGFNDVSFRGSSQIPTPNIDALAFSGIILNNYYVSPICTPTRSALFSGIHPIHTGMQNNVIYGAQPYGFPLGIKLLQEYLKELGYSTHLVGKWHMGHFRRKYTPLCRGFDTHYGPWTGHKDYYDNTAQEDNPQAWGYDMRRDFETTYENYGLYTTDLYTKEVKKLINFHKNSTKPFFLTVSHTAVHSANPYKLLQAPAETVERFSYIEDISRRTYAAMVSEMDKSLGETISSLGAANLLENSIIIFTTDNGGPASGFNGNAASNWPLRGVKNTLWEGGVRGVGVIWSPLLQKTPRVSAQLFHVQDWFPTLVKAIGQNPSELGEIDGIDMWEILKNEGNASSTGRTEVLHNIDDIYGNEAVRQGEWKLMHGTTYGGKWDGWYGPSGFETSTVQLDRSKETSSKSRAEIVENAFDSVAGKTIKTLWPTLLQNKTILENLMEESLVSCHSKSGHMCDLKGGEFCLFDVLQDPCEYNNLATIKPEIVKELKELLLKYRKSVIPPINKPKDPRGQPKFWNYTWTNWMDFIEPENVGSSVC